MKKNSPRKRCIIIAEAGVNHNGSLKIAKQLVRTAAQAGADFVKFQTFNPDHLATGKAPKAGYQNKNNRSGEGQRDMLRNLCLSHEQFQAVRAYCRREGIGFLSTAFDFPSLKFVESLKPKFHKVSSGDLDNLPFLRQIALAQRPVIISTGMATLREIQTALETLKKAGLPKRKIILLQCHTGYPTQPHEANLRVMETLRRKFQVRTGLSDHTTGILVGVAAVAMGASVLEKHITLNRRLPGPDHRASLEPEEFKALVIGARIVEQALGSGFKEPSKGERKIIKRVRKYLVAQKKIFRGERFNSSNLAVKRSGGGVPASRWDEWMGKRADRNYRQDEVIRL